MITFKLKMEDISFYLHSHHVYSSHPIKNAATTGQLDWMIYDVYVAWIIEICISVIDM
jgi:hypothetical protein